MTLRSPHDASAATTSSTSSWHSLSLACNPFRRLRVADANGVLALTGWSNIGRRQPYEVVHPRPSSRLESVRKNDNALPPRRQRRGFRAQEIG